MASWAVLALCAPFAVIADETTETGYVVDKLSWDNGGDICTNPGGHLIETMVGTDAKASGYIMLVAQDADASGCTYAQKFKFEDHFEDGQSCETDFGSCINEQLLQKEHARGVTTLGEVLAAGAYTDEGSKFHIMTACITIESEQACVGAGATGTWPGAASGGAATPEAVHAYWDNTNIQHTFHFAGEPWTHETQDGASSNTEEQQDLMFYAYREKQDNTEPVYVWWDHVNRQHTFHFEPAWKHCDADGANCQDESKDVNRGSAGALFYAYPNQAPHAWPIYSFWEAKNNQHTFHLEPAWGGEVRDLSHTEHHGPNHGFVFWAYKQWPAKAGELKSVFDFWDNHNKQHTFHFAPAWEHGGTAEAQGRVQFAAYDGPITMHGLHAKPVYDFSWDKDGHHQVVFHLLPKWNDGFEGARGTSIQYWVFDETNADMEAEGLVPIYAFWDSVNFQHTFHMEGAWANEEQQELMFYAFAPNDDTVQGVYAWWDSVNKQHTFHLPPAWKHPAETGTPEEQKGHVFSCHTGAHEGTEPVCDTWDNENKQHKFHLPAAGDSSCPEGSGGAHFYAFREQVNPNLTPIYEFWNAAAKDNTYHLLPEWSGEVQSSIVFYCYESDSEAYVPPVPTPTPTVAPTEPAAEPLVKTLGFSGTGATFPEDQGDIDALLEQCSNALASAGITCTGVTKQESTGIVELVVSGPDDAVGALEADWATTASVLADTVLADPIVDYDPDTWSSAGGQGAGISSVDDENETQSTSNAIAFDSAKVLLFAGSVGMQVVALMTGAA